MSLMQSFIHVLDWRANVHPQVTALADDRGAVYDYARLRAEVERLSGGWAALARRRATWSRSWRRTAPTSSCTLSR